MKTLYDLLGALPKDDAEELRTAFRKAAKGAHPDLHPGDPDAALKFREIVRASEILGDTEQRAAYDHLLELAHLEQVSASKHATAARFHRFASGVMAVAGVSIMTAGSYLLFMQMSVASLAPADSIIAAVLASVSAEPSTTGKSLSAVNEELSGIPREDVEPSAILPPANAKTAPAGETGRKTQPRQACIDDNRPAARCPGRHHQSDDAAAAAAAVNQRPVAGRKRRVDETALKCCCPAGFQTLTLLFATTGGS